MIVKLSLKLNIILVEECPNILTGLTTYKVRLPRFLAFPDSRTYKVDLYDGNSFVKSLDLKASATYNYSYVLFDVNYKYNSRPMSLDAGIETRSNPNVPTVIDNSIIEYTNAIASEITDFNSSRAIEDNMNLIVSEAVNPYYFPPEHSYLMPGEIINLSVNTEQISTSQVGQFPLYVFTTEGIYALQVGKEKVLYSNVIPISSEVAVKGSDVLQPLFRVAELQSRRSFGKNPDTGKLFCESGADTKIYQCGSFTGIYVCSGNVEGEYWSAGWKHRIV